MNPLVRPDDLLTQPGDRINKMGGRKPSVENPLRGLLRRSLSSTDGTIPFRWELQGMFGRMVEKAGLGRGLKQNPNCVQYVLLASLQIPTRELCHFKNKSTETAEPMLKRLQPPNPFRPFSNASFDEPRCPSSAPPRRGGPPRRRPPGSCLAVAARTPRHALK